MEFIRGDQKKAARMLALRLIQEIVKGRRVLWLICGGSNVALAAEAWNEVKAVAVKGELGHLYITLTDERFGPVGHKDSNWQQLSDAGLQFGLVNAHPVLHGLSLEETVARYGENFKKLRYEVDVVIALFGIGADGHIAGALPHSPAIESSMLAEGYQANNFTRLTLTPRAMREIDVAFACVFGESKKEVVRELRDRNIPLKEQPAQILKELPEAYFISDQM